MIGLVDHDLMFAPKKKKLNLEIMKLYSFLRQNNTVKLLTDIETINDYEKIYWRKDRDYYYSKKDLPQGIDIEWGGLAYTKKKYIPFSNLQIERSNPDPYVYYDFLFEMVNKNIFTIADIEKMMTVDYLRLFGSNSVSDLAFLKGNRNVMLYDTNLPSSIDWYETFIDLEKSIRRIHLVNMIHMDYQQLIKFLSIKKLCYPKEGIMLDVGITPADLLIVLESNNKLISRWSYPYLKFYANKNYIDNCYDDEWCHNSFIYALWNIKVAINQNILLHAVDYKTLLISEKYKDIFRLLSLWSASRATQHFTFKQYCLKNANKKTKQVIIQMYNSLSIEEKYLFDFNRLKT
jgi:hypothetical protein